MSVIQMDTPEIKKAAMTPCYQAWCVKDGVIGCVKDAQGVSSWFNLEDAKAAVSEAIAGGSLVGVDGVTILKCVPYAVMPVPQNT